MAKEIFMPKLSSTMETGTLIQWFKEEGDQVEVGEPIFEIMTDKINIEVESYEEGIILKKYYQADDSIPVNAVIGYIGNQDEQVPNHPPTKPFNSTSSDKQEELPKQEINQQQEKIRATPAARRVAKEQQIQLDMITGTGPKGRIQERDVTNTNTNKKLATPLAKKIANKHDIDINHIKGSGARGKVEKDDVLKHIETNAQPPISLERKKLTGLRKTIAEKMLDSARTIPHVTITSEIDMSNVIEMRQELLPLIEQKTGLRLSITEIIMKATAHALGEHPNVNASFINNEIIFNQSVHIGLAVSVPNGLLVPVVRDVHLKGFRELTENCKALSRKARENQLSLSDMTGSTFTISNLGMYEIDAFTPIINPPETAILGVGRTMKKPVVMNDSIEIRPMMVLSLSFDHRVIDGAPAAEFLTTVKECLENPYSLLI